MGEWFQNSHGRWVYDEAREPRTPSPADLLGGTAMSDIPRSVYDPDLGSDGGGRYAELDPLAVVDEHGQFGDPDVEQVYTRGPQFPEPPAGWEIDSAQTGIGPLDHDDDAALGSVGAGLVACPTCGTGVDVDRLRR